MKGFQRKAATPKQKKKDFFQTNPKMAKALREWLEDNGVSEHSSICEPACGYKVITNELSNFFYNIFAYDLHFGRRKRNFFLHNKTYDIIVMNMPYSDKYNFIDKARKKATTVICLMLLHVSSYNDFVENYEDIPEFVGQIKMTPKMVLSESVEDKRGGTAMYAWYIWDKRNNTPYYKTWIKNLFKLRS